MIPTQQDLADAIQCSDLNRVKQLIPKGAKVNAQSNFGNTPLHNAYSNLAISKLLLEAGANPNIPNRRNNLPIHLAAEARTETLEYLMTVSNLQLKGSENRTFLHFISLSGMSELIPKVIVTWLEMDMIDDNDMTPVMLAAEKGHKAAVVVLIREGADLSLKNKQGKTALTLARDNAHAQVVEVLEEATKCIRL